MNAANARAAYLRSVDQLITRDGWAITGVAENNACHTPGCNAPHEDVDPFLYTVGLTEVGLPELLLEHMPVARASVVLNDLARHSLVAELDLDVLHRVAGEGSYQVERVPGPEGLRICKVAKVRYGARLRVLRLLPASLVEVG